MRKGFWRIDGRWYCNILGGAIRSGMVFSTVRQPRRYWSLSLRPLVAMLHALKPKRKPKARPVWVSSAGAYWHRIFGPIGYFRVFAPKGISNQAGQPMRTGHYRTGSHEDYVVRWGINHRIA